MNRLDELENQSIYIIREAYCRFEKIAALWSMGKDSTVLLALTRKAFMGTVPFPVVHIDTGKKFESMYAFRDKWAQIWNLNLIVAASSNEVVQKTSNVSKLSCCNLLKTKPLRRIVRDYKFDALMLGIRRDEHGIRAKERHFSPRDNNFKWDYENQPPEFWNFFGLKTADDTHIRIHPILEWTERDVWQYIKKENLPVVDLYFSKDGKRYRSIGCTPCCEPVDSDAGSIDEIIQELKDTRTSERQGRAQDKESAHAMQQLRALGYM